MSDKWNINLIKSSLSFESLALKSSSDIRVVSYESSTKCLDMSVIRTVSIITCRVLLKSA